MIVYPYSLVEALCIYDEKQIQRRGLTPLYSRHIVSASSGRAPILWIYLIVHPSWRTLQYQPGSIASAWTTSTCHRRIKSARGVGTRDKSKPIILTTLILTMITVCSSAFCAPNNLLAPHTKIAYVLATGSSTRLSGASNQFHRRSDMHPQGQSWIDWY